MRLRYQKNECSVVADAALFIISTMKKLSSRVPLFRRDPMSLCFIVFHFFAPRVLLDPRRIFNSKICTRDITSHNRARRDNSQDREKIRSDTHVSFVPFRRAISRYVMSEDE